MSGSDSATSICVAYRDDGFWRQVLYAAWLILKRGRIGTFPPTGFVGLVSMSSRVTEAPQFRLRSIRMVPLQRLHVTSHVRLWRLTCEWGTPLHPSRPLRSGARSVHTGKYSGADGVADSSRPTRTTST